MCPDFPVPPQFPCLKMDMETVPPSKSTLRINVAMFLAQSKTSVNGVYDDDYM